MDHAESTQGCQQRYVADGLHLVALSPEEYEPVMLFINHSCEPNVGFAGNVVLVARYDIDPGQKLTTDYALFDDYNGQMTCNCAAASCRGVIDGHDWRTSRIAGQVPRQSGGPGA